MRLETVQGWKKFRPGISSWLETGLFSAPPLSGMDFKTKRKSQGKETNQKKKGRVKGRVKPRKTATRTEKQFYQQITRLRDARGVSVTPIPLCNQEEWRCRYVFGYSLDDSDKPVFLIWPERTGNNGFWLLDVARNQHNLCQATSIRNLGLEHFYAGFGLGCSRNLRTSSARGLWHQRNDISEDCSVPSGIAMRLRPLTHGTPCETHIQKKAKIDPQEIEAPCGGCKRGKQSELL